MPFPPSQFCSWYMEYIWSLEEELEDDDDDWNGGKHLPRLHVVTRRRRVLRSLKVAGPIGEHLHLGHLRAEPWEHAQPILGTTAIELALKWHASNVVLQASTERP